MGSSTWFAVLFLALLSFTSSAYAAPAARVPIVARKGRVLCSNIPDLKNHVLATEKKFNKALVVKKDIQSQVRSLKKNELELQNAVAKYEAELTELNDEKVKISGRIRKLKPALKKSDEKLQDAVHDRTALNKKLTTAYKDANTAFSKAGKATRIVLGAKRKLRSAEKKKKKKSRPFKRNSRRVQKDKKSKKAARKPRSPRNSVATLKKEIKALDSKISELRKQRDSIKAELGGEEKNLELLTADIDKVKLGIAEKRSELENVKAALTTAVGKLQNADVALAHIGMTLRAAKTQITLAKKSCPLH